MLVWKPPPVAVLCWPVTVIAGVRTAAGVFLAADRAAVDPAQQIAAGVYADVGDRTKLVISSGGVAVAVAGCAGTGSAADGEAANLLAAVQAVTADVTDGALAAIQVRRLFERSAAAVRRYAAPLGEPSVLPPFERAVRTMALVSGPEPGGPRLYAVGLTTEGAGGPVERAGQLIGAAVAGVSRTNPNLVSLDWDSVLVGSDGAGPIREHRHPRRVAVPRH